MAAESGRESARSRLVVKCSSSSMKASASSNCASVRCASRASLGIVFLRNSSTDSMLWGSFASSCSTSENVDHSFVPTGIRRDVPVAISQSLAAAIQRVDAAGAIKSTPGVTGRKKGAMNDPSAKMPASALNNSFNQPNIRCAVHCSFTCIFSR